MKTVQIFNLLLLFPLLLLPLANPTADPSQSPVDDITRWLENAFADIQAFFDNLGENIARAIENMMGSVGNLGQAIQDQFKGIGEGIQQD
jgi:hypothetical protein